ncbi:MFS transporter [Streptomyces sp. S.PB5]|uniref:MFS transporter n=1 Tax=Streptomyces sp. S.PB5 TaxID=3020844 RepID=UPI0025AF9690|nr:MFS transporter [Streptomyces sp. S.PB5]MDN3022230.1 MFS transporter [Streptomyces sp. S.PB5]
MVDLRAGGAAHVTAPRPSRGAILAVALLLNQFVVALAGSSVATVGPGFRTAMGVSATALPWAVIVYVLALGVLLLPFRWLCGRIGPFLVLLGGLWMFVQSSVVIGTHLVTTPHGFLALRGVQGAGAAALTAVALMLMPVRVRPAWSAVILGGLGVGLLLGSAVPGDSWRWVFWANVPLAVLSGMTTLGLLRGARRRPA